MKALAPEELYRCCEVSRLPFTRTDELAHESDIVGQERAVAAVQFAISVPQEGYHLFALGPTGTGKRFLVEHFLRRHAASRPAPPDLCYVYTFSDPTRPTLLQLPSGTAPAFREVMLELIGEVRSSLSATFESEEYQARRHAIDEEAKERPESAFAALQEQAKRHSLGMVRTPLGLVFAPLRGGEVVTPEQFKSLPPEEQERLRTEIDRLQQELQRVLRQVPQWERQRRERIRDLHRELASLAIGPLFDEACRKCKYQGLEPVLAYLESVRQDVIDNLQELMQLSEAQAEAGFDGAVKIGPALRRYQVNVLVEHQDNAPIIFEDNPTFANLVGRIEYQAQQGNLVTDFTLLRPGALHRANGGYLLLEARKLLQHPYAYEGLKRALSSRRLAIESLGQALSLTSTVTIEPEPLPLDVKVVLLGDRLLYYLLCAYDPEFTELFKVAADFDDSVPRTPEAETRYAGLIGALARRYRLRPLSAAAVARIIEQAARLTGDAERLTARLADLRDLLQEADHHAAGAAHEVIALADVELALAAQLYRADRLQQRMLEETLRHTRYIATDGEAVGQINGLSVVQLGTAAFGHPSRITARVRLGEGSVVDIEREVELGGPLHSKGVLILSALLGARYAADEPFSLAASLVFEQSYGGVEGDSASCAEFFALVSALAEAPLKQGLAVTGSLNQHGEVQPVGGVNEKIEGFFELCQARGLTGSQGVLIPRANAKHLMLAKAVVAAVAAGRFGIYALDTVDDGLALLTGLSVGVKDDRGEYPATSLNGRVVARLRALTRARRAFKQE
jgi:lon-related putative ATP-dependent protease